MPGLQGCAKAQESSQTKFSVSRSYILLGQCHSNITLEFPNQKVKLTNLFLLSNWLKGYPLPIYSKTNDILSLPPVIASVEG